MNKLSLIALVVALFFAVRGDAQQSTQPQNPVIQGWVRMADHIKLPAEDSGVLIHLGVKEGTQVRAGQELGKIDDRDIQTQKNAAFYAREAAVKRWKDDVDIRYAEAGAAVAKADYEQLQETNRLAEKAITAVDLRRAKLEWDKMVLAAERARHEQELAKFEAYMKQAELDAAKLAIERRVIISPFDGVVEDLLRKQDEWVNPGDTILRLLRLDTMHVSADVDQEQYDPHELPGCEVTVEVQLARGRKETVRGRIVKVSSIIGGHGMYNIRAEVANRQEHGSWMLRDGLPAAMTIHLGTGGAAAAGTAAAASATGASRTP